MEPPEQCVLTVDNNDTKRRQCFRSVAFIFNSEQTSQIVPEVPLLAMKK